MAMICSPDPELDNLMLRRLPAGRVTTLAKGIRIDNDLIFVGADGKVYTSFLKEYAYLPGMYRWMENLLTGLTKLEVISKEVAAMHKATCERAEARDRKRFAAKQITQYAETLGVKLTKAQLAAIDKAKGKPA